MGVKEIEMCSIYGKVIWNYMRKVMQHAKYSNKLQVLNCSMFLTLFLVLLRVEMDVKGIEIVTLLCNVIAYVMWLKLANHVILTTCLEIRLACKFFEADESLVLLNFKIPTTLW